MNFETLRCDRRDGVAIVTLSRPAARNALDEVMRRELPALIEAIRSDPEVSAVVLTGAGGAFCAGGDLRAMSATRRTAWESRQRIHALHDWLPGLVNLEKPVVAAVDGPAYGGGFSLALAADMVLASRRARFCMVFGRIGLVPDMAAMYLLPRIVGLQRAKELVFSAREIDAEEALRLGIVLGVHEPDELLDNAVGLARRLCSASPVALGLSKNILNQSFQLDQHVLAELESHAQGMCMDSAYHRKAVAAFLNGEPAAFKWDRPDSRNSASATGEPSR